MLEYIAPSISSCIEQQSAIQQRQQQKVYKRDNPCSPLPLMCVVANFIVSTSGIHYQQLEALIPHRMMQFITLHDPDFIWSKILD